VKSFEKELERHVGQVYRVFIRAGRAFYLNQQVEPVPVHDPLWGQDPNTIVHSDETYEVKYTNAEGTEICAPVRTRLVILPDQGSTSLNEKAGYRSERSGFYVLRNNREIAAAQLLGLSSLRRHPDFIRFRGELFVTGRLDEALGFEFTKRDVKPTQSIRDQLNDLVGADLKSIRNQLRKQKVMDEGGDLDHSGAERLIDSKSALLIKPAHTSTDGETATPLGTVKFRVAHFGRDSVIFSAEQQGRTTLVDWNADHPFYEKFVIANRDDREALNAVDSMIFSMAAAELKVFNEDQQHFIDAWRQIFSANLRTLLS
jgi:hypothetical protein